MLHTHRFSFLTRLARNHRHRMSGFTTYQADVRGHRHVFFGSTTLSLDHVHFFTNVTGPPVRVRGGEHFHRMRGRTSFILRHSHAYNGRSQLDRDLPRNR
ncbi:hypothetical protein H1S01_19295 [Heliobacterium chlorum]|uniref:Uncharacterized protein n=1 Tax=Heliobacterium chlorum TaxID=2698 RepID=A0ABR7T907_HELCL|nr:hypothetical protein [Heliobacterium chlorum]